MADVTVPTDLNCDVILASNAVPTKSQAYQESGDSTPVHAYARANANTVAVQTIYGRTAPVGFRTAEGRSDVFNRALLVAMDTSAHPVLEANMDRAAFDPIISLIEDTAAPHVAVCDGHGRRWFCFCEFVSGSYNWTLHEHQAEMKFTEVATVPAAVVTSSPATP